MKTWNKSITSSATPEAELTVRDVFADLYKGNYGDIDKAIQRTEQVLPVMKIGDELVVRDVIDSDYPGEYTEWYFKKCSDYKFITTRRERVYTGSGRTGFEIQTFGEGTWSADSVVQQATYNTKKVIGFYVYPEGEYKTTTFFERRV